LPLFAVSGSPINEIVQNVEIVEDDPSQIPGGYSPRSEQFLNIRQASFETLDAQMRLMLASEDARP
jgi:hypothetical protein